MQKTANYLDLLPYYSIEDDVLILKDARVVVGYQVTPVQYESLTRADYYTLANKFESILKAAPDYINITFYNIFFEGDNEAVGYLENSFLQSKAKEHFDRPMLHHKIYMFVGFDSEKEVNASTTIFARCGNIQLANFKNIEAKKEDLISFCAELTSLLSLFSIEFNQLDEDELNNLIWQYSHLDFSRDYNGLESDMYNTDNAYIIGDKIVNTLTLEGQGDKVDAYKDYKYSSGETVSNPFVADVGLCLEVPHILVQCFKKVNKDKSLKPFEKEKGFNENLPGIPMFHKQEIRSNQLGVFLDEMHNSENCLIRYALHVILYSNDPKIQHKQIEAANKAINNLNHAKAILDSFDTGNIFVGCVPGNTGQLYRNILIPSDVASTQLNLVSNYITDKQGDFFCDRFNNMILVDLFHDELKSKNKLVIGPSGSGKSFVQGHLVSLAHEREELQVIIDKGGTYKNLVSIHNGLYFEHTEENPLQFNPFVIDKDEKGHWKLDNDKVVFLKTLLSIIWKAREDGDVFTKAEGAVLSKLIPEYYEYENTLEKSLPNLGRFVDFIKSYNEKMKSDEEWQKEVKYFDINQFVLVLQPFTEGIYKNIFVNDSQINLSEQQLICFDLDAIQKDAILYPIISMLIIELVLDHIRKFPHKIKHIIFDEAWAMFTGEMGDFIINMYRTIRKHNGEITVITQSAMDLDGSALGQVLISNTEVKIILNHSGKDFEALQKAMKFTDHEIELIKSMRMEKTARELFIKRGTVDSRVYSLEVPLDEYAILTTTPKEKNHFNGLRKKHGNLSRAVYEFVQDFKSHAISN